MIEVRKSVRSTQWLVGWSALCTALNTIGKTVVARLLLYLDSLNQDLENGSRSVFLPLSLDRRVTSHHRPFRLSMPHSCHHPSIEFQIKKIMEIKKAKNIKSAKSKKIISGNFVHSQAIHKSLLQSHRCFANCVAVLRP